jgi:predicted dinucleotide-binding enzyme
VGTAIVGVGNIGAVVARQLVGGVAEAVIDRLIRTAGFDPLKVGGVDDAGRIEAPGGDLQGALLDLDQAHTTINRKDTL